MYSQRYAQLNSAGAPIPFSLTFHSPLPIESSMHPKAIASRTLRARGKDSGQVREPRAVNGRNAIKQQVSLGKDKGRKARDN